jgi:hypothetical protein
MVEPSEKVSIGGANPRRRSRAERIGITEIKIEKGERKRCKKKVQEKGVRKRCEKKV